MNFKACLIYQCSLTRAHGIYMYVSVCLLIHFHMFTKYAEHLGFSNKIDFNQVLVNFTQNSSSAP